MRKTSWRWAGSPETLVQIRTSLIIRMTQIVVVPGDLYSLCKSLDEPVLVSINKVEKIQWSCHDSLSAVNDRQNQAAPDQPYLTPSHTSSGIMLASGNQTSNKCLE